MNYFDLYEKEFDQVSSILQRPFNVTHRYVISRLTCSEYSLVELFFKKYNDITFYLIINIDCDNVILTEESTAIDELGFTSKQIDEMSKLFPNDDECKLMCYAVDGNGFIHIKNIHQKFPNVKYFGNQFHKLKKLSNIIFGEKPIQIK